ncbi:MAG TPA: hypothetical protein PK728_02315 [Bacillota bacterium]|nr:hypothetical protein [Bacillota bacterium]
MGAVETLPNWPEVISIIEADEGLTNTKNIARRIAGLLGLCYIGHGAHRVVLDYESMALKVALNRRGILENYRECALFFSLPEKEKKLFAACFGSGYGWALFERLEPMSYCRGYREHREKMNSIKKKIAGLGINDIISPRNWGIRDGKEPVILDYSFYQQ